MNQDSFHLHSHDLRSLMQCAAAESKQHLGLKVKHTFDRSSLQVSRNQSLRSRCSSFRSQRLPDRTLNPVVDRRLGRGAFLVEKRGTHEQE